MLHIIITTILYLIIFYGYGNLLNKYFNRINLISFKIINGLLFIGIISLLTAIFIPLNIYYEIGIILIGFLLAIYFRFWKVKLPNNKFIYGLFLVSCFVGSMNAYIFDTFSYYFPTIKWLDDYGLVRGLANFDFNLGQTSLWHIIQASFNQTIDSYYKINVLITVVYILYLYEVKKLIFLIFLPIFFLFIASPSTDLPIFILSLIIILNWLINQNKDSIRYGLILSSFLVLIKPIAFVLPIFFFFLSFKECKSFFKVYVIVGFLSFLFIVKNIILTGNITFPLAIGNLKFLDFSIPERVYYFSGIDGKYLITSRIKPVVYEDFETWSLIKYYTYIFNNLHLSVLLYLFISVINVLFLIYTIFKKNKILFFLSCLMILKVLLFWVISIQYRFILDSLLMICCVLLFRIDFKNIYLYGLCIITSFLLVFSSKIDFLKDISFMGGIADYKLIKIIYPYNYKVKTERIYFSNFQAHFVLNSDVSTDIKQPSLNNRLINKYKNENLMPKLIDSTDINKGFIKISLDTRNEKEIESLLKFNSSEKNIKF